MLAGRKEPSDDRTGCQKLSESLCLEVKGERQAAACVIIPWSVGKTSSEGREPSGNDRFLLVERRQVIIIIIITIIIIFKWLFQTSPGLVRTRFGCSPPTSLKLPPLNRPSCRRWASCLLITAINSRQNRWWIEWIECPGGTRKENVLLAPRWLYLHPL